MYCKPYTKAKGLSKESQGRNIKILHSRSVDMLVFKNNWPTCVYMIKYNTKQGDIRKPKSDMMILGLHAIFPAQGYGAHAQGSGSCLAILLPGLTISVF